MSLLEAQVDFNVQRQVKMGLGEAVLRLIHVEIMYANGVFAVPDHLKLERDMIVQALNQFELDLGFDCNMDGAPDTVDIFKQSVETSCCRIVPRDTSRRAPAEAPAAKPEAPAKPKARRTSRRTE